MSAASNKTHTDIKFRGAAVSQTVNLATTILYIGQLYLGTEYEVCGYNSIRDMVNCLDFGQILKFDIVL